MNKAELISAIAKSADITRDTAEKVLESFMANIEETLKKDDKLTLVGFGTFSMSKRAARKGRNPRNGKELDIPAKNIAKFKPGSKLSEIVK